MNIRKNTVFMAADSSSQAGGGEADKGTPPPADGAAPAGDKGTEGGSDKKSETGDGEPAKSKEGASAAFEIKLPDGVQVDKDTLDWFTKTAKDKGMTSEQASGIAASFAEFQASQAKALETEKADWEKAIKADPEIGGAKFAENQQTSLSAVKRFGTPGFINLLNETGLGSHPEVFRTFLAIGGAIKEDNTASSKGGGGGAPPTDKELNDIRFPTSKNVGGK